MQHAQIIDQLSERLGNQQKLADRLGVDDSRLSKWKGAGIPPRRWPELLRIAKRQGYRLTLNQLENGSPNRSATAKPARAA